MFEEFEPQGLVLLALSDESASTITNFMEHTPMPYPVAAGQKSSRVFGVDGIPAAFLLDHEGQIVWQGHPAAGDWVGMLPGLLAAAADAGPSWNPGPRPEELAKAVVLAGAGRIGEALDAADKVRAKDAAAVEAFLADAAACAERRVERARALGGEGRYFEATDYLAKQAAAWKGSEHAARFEDLRSEWVLDKGLKDLMALDKKRCQANEQARGGKADKAAKTLEKLLEDAGGTPLEAAITADLQRARATK